MHPFTVSGDNRLLLWSRVRQFAVPPSMIQAATARRAVGDWAGACAAARVDVDLDLRAAGRAHGWQFAKQVRADLRRLAPDLLRWHFPRIGPDGLLRPGCTVSLARYRPAGHPVHLVARTPPAWAYAGQRLSLALWDSSRPRDGARGHPHPRPDRHFRLDLHRHLWDARRSGELWQRSGAAQWPPGGDEIAAGAVHRWVDEAALLLRADGCADSVVTVRLDKGRRVMLDLGAPTPTITVAPRRDCGRMSPVLPDAATWVLPDLELFHAGLIDAERLHPLVASALLPDHRPAAASRSPDTSTDSRFVDCRGATHRIGVVNGVLVPLDHDPGEIRREELLVALGGTPLPCLQAIDAVHRHPEDLVDVRARLDHGDTAGALAAVEGLLGPDALLRHGALRDALDTAVRHQVAHGMFRAELVWLGPRPHTRVSRRRAHTRHATQY
ncbi:hypothetical protein [Kibdelosporangium phytohabitans]|uniref:Uncharacterized protein n=1 Tax=Kibdelosporangium phytohabitans TaxID=860235 RepID=A0A0N9IEY3_9PSEU|nr:hypothetical protein [Kibdelosporangium phytohabitans]ALG15069.1 hypothetical protein AOZ06_25990 [Kibdelosporangium phytohabitans]MBE1468710.1 hypothetical protein [Kibdelosporangium phytohabitans]